LTPDGAAKPPEKGPKARLVSIDQLDRRSKAAQLALKAKNDILADLGGESELSTIERLLCDHASLASPVVADGYARWLAGEQIPLPELATAQNAFLRIAGMLGRGRRSKDITKSIDAYLEEASVREVDQVGTE
jgi:hypothetical protein